MAEEIEVTVAQFRKVVGEMFSEYGWTVFHHERALMFCMNDGNLFSVTREQYDTDVETHNKAGLVPPKSISDMAFVHESMCPSYMTFGSRVIYSGFGDYEDGKVVIRVGPEECIKYECLCSNVPDNILRVRLATTLRWASQEDL